VGVQGGGGLWRGGGGGGGVELQLPTFVTLELAGVSGQIRFPAPLPWVEIFLVFIDWKGCLYTQMVRMV